jgi:1-aminocyclopropane-1-carboxylate deaminase
VYFCAMLEKEFSEAINEELLLPEFEKNGFSVAIKREDLVFPFASGNKWRKLKYNLQAFKSSSFDGILSFGGAYSNHLSATAALTALEQIPSIGIVRGDELEHKPLNPTLAQCQANGMLLVFVSRNEYALKEQGQTAQNLLKSQTLYVLPEGGSNALAVKGCTEILSPADLGYDVVGCAVGTGGTLAGLATAAFPHQQVVGFQCANDAMIPERIRTFVSRENWILLQSPVDRRYGQVGEPLVAFAKKVLDKTGVLLDPIYTAPMLFQLVQMIENNTWKFGTKILLIHTGGTQGIAGFNAQKNNQWPEV